MGNASGNEKESATEDINSEMIWAIRKGKYGKVNWIIKTYGLSHCAAWVHGFIPLRDAIEHRHSDVARLLINSGAKIYSKNQVNTPLHLAAKNQDIEIVKLLLEKGADVNARNADGTTPVHIALELNNQTILSLIFSELVICNAKDKFGKSLLHIAAREGNTEIVHHLLKGGANVNCEMQRYPDKGITPLHFASACGKVEIVKLLMDYNANVNAKSDGGKLSLQIAFEKGHVAIIQALVESNADVNLKVNGDKTLLHCACEHGKAEIVKILLKSQADVNAKQSNGKTALHIACEKNRADIVEALIESHADVNAQLSDGKTPLFIACGGGRVGIVRALLESHADANLKQADGQTVLQIAGKNMDKHFAAMAHFEALEELLEICPRIRAGDLLPYIPRSYFDKSPENSQQVFSTLLDFIDISDTPNLTEYISSGVGKDILGYHVLKLRWAKLDVPIAYSHLIPPELKDYECICKEELARMMSEKIEKTNISFHDILTTNISAVARIIRNEDVMRAFNSGDYKRKYPWYAGILLKQIQSGIERNDLTEAGAQFLLMLFPLLPWTCAVKIINLLTKEELKKILTENRDP